MKFFNVLVLFCALVAAHTALAKPSKVNELHAKPGSKLHGLDALNSLLGRRAAEDDLPPTSAEPGTTETTPEDLPETTSLEPGDTVPELDTILTSPTPELDDLP